MVRLNKLGVIGLETVDEVRAEYAGKLAPRPHKCLQTVVALEKVGIHVVARLFDERLDAAEMIAFEAHFADGFLSVMKWLVVDNAGKVAIGKAFGAEAELTWFGTKVRHLIGR